MFSTRKTIPIHVIESNMQEAGSEQEISKKKKKRIEPSHHIECLKRICFCVASNSYIATSYHLLIHGISIKLLYDKPIARFRTFCPTRCFHLM